MTEPRPLPADRLAPRCDPRELKFETTADLEPLREIVGQARALEAVRFGIGIRREGYNLYALGPAGIGKHTAIQQVLEQEARGRPLADDWCYVHNFRERHKPVALRLPPGRGPRLRRDMEQLVQELRASIPAMLESDEYRAQMQEIDEELKEKQEQAFAEIRRQAEQEDMVVLNTPHGFAVAPTGKGEVMSPQEFEQLSNQERERKQQSIARLQEQLARFLEEIPRLHKERRERRREVERKFTMSAVGHVIDALQESYRDLPSVFEYLEAVQQDVVENVRDFRVREEGAAISLPFVQQERPSFTRYQVNVLVAHEGEAGAPIVYEDNPTYPNLIGRVEHVAQFGALITDFTLIKPGALHRANGGYLLLDMFKLLTQPYAWDGLKRTLRAQKVTIESLGQMLGVFSTVSLEPEPIPLDFKVVLMGERLLYYLLCAYDPDFRELFKVAADFDDRVERSPENNGLYARLIATLAGKERLRPFDRSAVARVIDHGARLAEDAERLSAHLQSIGDLLREADFCAEQAGRDVVQAADIQHAIDGQIRRADRIRERLYEEINRGTILIDTKGERVGQVNALSVVQLGDFSFGQPSRITATTRPGKGEVVDIEREVELGGALHSKGVLILSNFLGWRYAQEQPLSLAASLVFEQSYGMVEGDSASVAELCALLSALANAPLNQALAVTGSVNQHGQVQAIGGVNEKVEGFFDVCNARGLTGEQGVLIPVSNVKHLMLREDVVQAATAGKFHVYPVATVDEAISLLTGVRAGERDAQGAFPEGSINYRVDVRLRELSETLQKFAEAMKGERSSTDD